MSATDWTDEQIDRLDEEAGRIARVLSAEGIAGEVTQANLQTRVRFHLREALRNAGIVLNGRGNMPDGASSQASRDVLAERERQKSVEGWTVWHDDMHVDGELAGAAAAYALASLRESDEGLLGVAWKLWPWQPESFKPNDTRRRELVKAGALILAELERIDRLDGNRVRRTDSEVSP